MSLKPYPSYKDSGLEWIGSVPDDWQVCRLKNILAQRITDGPHTTPTFTDEGFPFLSVDGIQNGELVFEGCRYVSPEDHQEFSRKAAPRLNDVLMGKAASTGKIARVKVDFEFSIWSPLALIRVDQQLCDARFVEYWLKSAPAQAQIDILCTNNTQKNISMDDIPKLDFLLPPMRVQRAIADYLDRETTELDAFIADQENLIGLLNERRAALADTLVWGGSSSAHAERKSMPIDPLPDVPSHWKVLRNKNIWTESNRLSDDGTEEMLTVSHITGVTPRSEKNVTMFEAASTEGYRLVSPGNLAINTMWAWMGALGTSAYSGIVSPAYGVYEAVDQRIDHRYFHHLYRSSQYVRLMTNFSRGLWSSRLRLYPWSFLALPTTLPPFAEQVSISDQIDSETAEIEAAITDAQEAIVLSKERRSAVITNAVTGSIDVRHVSMTERATIQGEPVGVA